MNMAVSLSRLGHDIHVFTPKTKVNKGDIYPEIKVHKQSAIIRFGQAPLTLDLLRLHDFDLIHLHFPYYFGGEIVTLISILKNIPIVISFHNDVIKPGLSGKLVRLHTKLVTPFVLNKAKYICVMSEEFTRESITINRLKDKSKLIIIPQGVDTYKFSPRTEKQLIAKLEPDNPFVLFVRTLDQAHFHSGLDYLLKAMVNVNNKCHLVVIGDGELKEFYQKMSGQLNLTSRVHFLGAVQNDQLPGYYSASSLFVLPSSETENAGVVLLEAMACGRPVIATSVGGSKEIVKDGRTGFLVPPKNPDALAVKINELLQNRELANKIGEQASIDVAKNSSWSTIAKQLEEVYTKVLCKSV